LSNSKAPAQEEKGQPRVFVERALGFSLAIIALEVQSGVFHAPLGAGMDSKDKAHALSWSRAIAAIGTDISA
jgi:hypothetical protein